MNTVNLPQDPKLAGKIVDAQASHEAQKLQTESQKLEMGYFGKLFGGKAGAPSNAASFIVYFGFFVFVILIVYTNDTPSLSKKEAIAAVSSLITLALGYLFGKSSRS